MLSHEAFSKQVGEATSAHLGATVKVQGGKVQVPLVFYGNRKDFGSPAEQLEFLKQSLPPALVSAVQYCTEKAQDRTEVL